MWLVQACRGCLSTEGKLEKVNIITWRMFEALTGLQFTETDGYPNMLCTECRWTLRKSIIFRRKCRRAFMALKQIMLEKKIVSENEIKKVNRKKNNLVSSIGQLQPSNTTCYNVNISESTNTKNVSMTLYTPEIEQSTVHTIDITPSAEEIPLDMDNSIEKYSDYEVINEELLENNELQPTYDSNDVTENISDIDNIYIDLDEEILVEEPDEESPELMKIESTIQINGKELSSTKENNKERRFYKTKKNYLKKLATALENCHVRALSAQEQLDIVKKRLIEPKFVNASFKCIICVTIFETVEDLQHHLSLHNMSKGHFHCDVCKFKFTFSVEADLLYHCCTQHKYEFTCNHCTKKFYSSTKLVTHMEKVHNIQKTNFSKIMMRLQKTPEEMYKTSIKKYKRCHVCTCSFSKRNLNSHVEKCQKPKVPTCDIVKCDICTIWTWKRNITKHIETHKYKYMCKICNKIYMAKKIAIRHLEKHKEDTKCDICKKRFKTSYWLLKHKLRSHKSFGKFHCSICGSNYNQQYLFYEHQLIEHGYFLVPEAAVTDAKLHCTKCDVQFINDKAYKTHSLLIHPELADKTNFCEACIKIFDNNDEFIKHQNECTYKCPYCPAALKYGLYHHILKEHPGLPFVHKTEVAICETCGKTVPTNILSQHLKKHEAQMKNTLPNDKCPFCNLNHPLWKNPNAMLLHIAKSHIDRPWQCRLCHKKWKKKDACKEHIMTKHGMYKLSKSTCEICHKLFRNNYNLRRHYRNLHGITYKTKNRLHDRLTKRRGKITVYPHMQLNLTGLHGTLSLSKKVLEKVIVEVWDYFYNLIGVAPDKFEFLKISETEQREENIDKDEMKRRQKIKIDIFDTSLKPSATFDSDSVKAEETNVAKKKAGKKYKGNINAKTSESIKTESYQLPSSSQSDSKPTIDTPLVLEESIKIESNQLPSSSQSESIPAIDTPLVQEESETCNAIVIDDDSSIIQAEDGNQYILLNGILYKIDK